VDLFSLSRMLEIAGSREQSVATCQRALSGGLPEEIEARALHQLALQYKRQSQHGMAVETWLELIRLPSPLALEAFEELAIHYEHRQSDPQSAMEFTLTALERLREQPSPPPHAERFTHRLERLQRKTARLQSAIKLPIT
jgi:tetratricopeptide (TPR) repeat protein